MMNKQLNIHISSILESVISL